MHDFTTQLYDFIKQLCQPYTLLCVLILLAVVNLWRRRAETRGRLLLVTIPLALLLLTSWPPIGYLALATLEWQYPPNETRPTDAPAIVVLNAGISYPDSVRKQAELEPDTMLRCMHAAKVYRQGPPCLVVVTGGTERGKGVGPSCAAVMRDAMLQMGVRDSDIVLEEKSLTTYENAVETARILRQRGIRRAVIVSDAPHLFRALKCFRKQGIDPVPSGCGYGSTKFRLDACDLLPNPMAAIAVIRSFHEWLGTAWYWWQRRV